MESFTNLCRISPARLPEALLENSAGSLSLYDRSGYAQDFKEKKAFGKNSLIIKLS